MTSFIIITAMLIVLTLWSFEKGKTGKQFKKLSDSIINSLKDMGDKNTAKNYIHTVTFAWSLVALGESIKDIIIIGVLYLVCMAFSISIGMSFTLMVTAVLLTSLIFSTMYAWQVAKDVAKEENLPA